MKFFRKQPEPYDVLADAEDAALRAVWRYQVENLHVYGDFETWKLMRRYCDGSVASSST